MIRSRCSGVCFIRACLASRGCGGGHTILHILKAEMGRFRRSRGSLRGRITVSVMPLSTMPGSIFLRGYRRKII